MKRKGGRPDSNRLREDHDLGCCRYTTATTMAKKAGTTGFEPATSRSTTERSGRAELRPRSSAGGIRTHGLELMRLARTASPLPRSLPGWSRTSGLRFPKPAGWPSPLRADEEVEQVRPLIPPAGLEPAASRVRAGRHRRFDHRGRNTCRSRRPWNRTRPCSISASRAAADTYFRRAPAAGLEPALRD
jgi:hypothetical protein